MSKYAVNGSVLSFCLLYIGLALKNLGACLNVEGKFTEAVDVLREAVSIRYSVSASPELKEISLNWLLKSLNDDGKFQQAEEEYQRWFRFEDLPLGNRHRKGVTFQMERSLQNQGKLKELDELKQTGQYTVQYAAPPPNVEDYSVQATAVSPTRDHRHASATAQATNQLPPSPLQAFLASQGWQFDVFICHAEPEKAFVAMLHDEMLKYGLKTFTDVETGGNETQVAEAIVRSPFFMVVVGHSFASSVTCEYEVEAALAFPDIHKKVVPIFYGMSVDECRQMDKQLYHRLASMTALHRGFKTDGQFAEVICQEVKEMAIDQLESNNLKMWNSEGLRIEGSLGQCEQLLQLKHAVKHLFNFVMESVLDNLGAEGKRHFLEAIAKGTVKIARVNLDMLGDGEAGKSSLGNSLMDEPLIAERESTEGANVIYMIQTATGYSTKWKKDEDRSYSLGCLLARGSVLAVDVDKQVNGTESKRVLPQAQSLSGTEENKEGVSISSMRVEDVEASSSMSVKAESKSVSGEGKWSVIFGAKAFEKAKELTEDRAQAIKSLQDNPEEVKRQNDFIHISVCDRGGQEPYFPIHMALIGNCSEFIPKAYMLVFDLSKKLNEIANATFRAQQGSNKMTYTRCRQVKNEEIIGHWASAVDLAHPEIQQQSGSCMRPFLGQHKVLRGPAMLIIGTHYDEIIARGEEGQQLVNEQEMAVKRILSEHKYIEHVVAADAEKNELIFKVDNTRSGTSHPDPMIDSIRKLIFDMAMAYRDDTEATPLPYVVMELGLLYVSQTVGPDGICDSDQKIVAIDNVVQLAEEYCDIKGISRCRTALKYLSGVGAIFYFFKAFGLTDKVFTDPQWLFDVMSTFVTILTENQISHLYWHDLKQLKEEGKMSRRLAEHLLQKRKQLGVKSKHYNTIFRLLQLIDVFCPHQASATLALEDVKEFYVPCMLEVDYEELTAWEKSGTTDGCDSTCLPPSLIFKPDNVDYFPEALFFRLSSRTAYQFPKNAQLKRNRIQVYIEDSGLSMELLYHCSCRYVIATIFPNDTEEPPTSEDFNRQCLFVRHFLCWQLNDAKLNGIDGFQWKLFFQFGKKPGTMDVDEESLYCLPEGDKMPKVIANPITKACLKKKESLTVKSWYSCDAPECGGDIATKSYLEQVAESVEEDWRKLAGAMKPRPFYRNELMKFEDVTDDNESGKALRMLQEWQREHKDQATLSNLKGSLAAAKLTHRIKCGHASSDVAHDASESAEHSVEATALSPTREHSHATPTVKAGPEQPQSPMQVESDPDMTGNAGNKLTAKQRVDIVERIAGDWEKFVVYLQPDFFHPTKIREIKKTEDNPFLQAQTALALWSDHYDEMATQDKVIKALCKAGFRAQAVEVFQRAQVDDVAP